MLTKYPRVLLAAFVLSLLSSSRSPAADTAPATRAAEARGTVAGRVQNVVTGNYLNNARVTLRGTDRVVFTNETGDFLLNDVPAGEIVLEIFHTGLAPMAVAVHVPEGKRIVRVIELGGRGG